MNVKLQEVYKSYGKESVLDNVSVEIPSGSLVAVLGGNGAGKSTMLGIMASAIGCSEGEVLLDDKPLCRDDIALRKRMVYIPDFPVLFPNKSVLENVAIYLKVWDAERSEKEIMDWAEKLGMLKYLDKNVGLISRGENYKCGLLATMSVDPDLCLIDEPFASGMDPRGIEFFKRYVRDSTARGKTIIYTTQLIDVAKGFADRILLINDKKIAADGTPEKLVNDGELDVLLGDLTLNE